MARYSLWETITRTRQKILAAFFFNMLTFPAVYICIILMVKLLLSRYWLIGVMYYAFVLIDDAPWKGNRMIPFIKNSTILKHACDYFPVKLRKTVDLDPSKNYIFAAFPHGTFACGYFACFGTEAIDFSKMFPGLTSRLMLHHLLFYTPFYRDILMAMSTCACTENSLKYLLDDKKFKGNCTIVVVGGTREGIESEPGKHRLILNKRKGFVRIAIQTGASLVPVYGFGETDIFRRAKFDENSYLGKISRWLLDNTGFMLIRMSGVGFFQDSFGWIPFRKPINVVVGAPLEVKKNLNPTQEEIDAVHAEYKERLIKLFESEKSKYIDDYENEHLEFVA